VIYEILYAVHLSIDTFYLLQIVDVYFNFIWLILCNILTGELQFINLSFNLIKQLPHIQVSVYKRSPWPGGRANFNLSFLVFNTLHVNI